MSARDASGFIPEQIWDQKAPTGETPGKPTRSMNPLNWAMAEYVTLLVSTGQGSVAG
jgi:glucoamylase